MKDFVDFPQKRGLTRIDRAAIVVFLLIGALAGILSQSLYGFVVAGAAVAIPVWFICTGIKWIITARV